jgi:hypothetical protein
LSANKRITPKMPVNSINFREILREVETAIERLEVLEYEVKKELESCAMVGA